METYVLNVGKASAMTSRSFAHKNKIVSVSQTVLSPAKWLGLSHRQAKHPRIMLTTEGRVLEEILKTKFNLRSSTEEEDELKIAPRP
jgi:hypothetical protein